VRKVKRARIIEDYPCIRADFPSSLLSNTYNHLLIKDLQLPSKFNLRTTYMLIRLHPDSDYKAPEAYVDNRLQLYGKKSRHLDALLTEVEMLVRGWVKLCVRVNWHPNYSLVDYVNMAIRYLEGLSE